MGGREPIAEAVALHQRGDLAGAEKIYLDILAADAGNIDALHYLGIVRHQQGQSLAGIDLVRRAIEIRPDYVDAVNNLGNIQHQLGCTVDAINAYKRALELRPDHPDAPRNLGIALRKLKRFEEAAEVYQQAIAQWPDKLENYYALANAYKDLARHEEAFATLRKALAIKAEAEGFRRLGQMLYGARRIDEAATNYEAWLRFDPASAVAKHMLAACTGKDVPARAADAFVTKVFDGFADDFDQVLNRLEYRAPALVGKALQRIHGVPRGDLNIMDAGCGTGLLAEYLRPYARRLVGVDLSQRMLEKAARRSLYDELRAGELTAYLDASRQAFDVVASSDTLVYFGDLSAVLAAAAASLRPGGKLVFTLEHAVNEDEAPAGYRLQPHGRYSHTERYVRERLAEAGFDKLEIDKAHLRWEGRAHVDGLLVAARLVNRPKARLESAIALHQQGYVQQAEAAYLELLEADENHPDALHYLAVMRYQQGRLLSALNLARRAIDANPASVAAFVNLGNVYRQLGVIAGAVEAYKSALELRPDDPEASRSLASVHEELTRLEQSAEAHRRDVEREPRDAEHLYRLAAVYQKIGGRTDDELAALRKALAIRPEPDAFRRVGIILSGMGRLDEVAATYEAWLRADPGDPVAKHLLAACTGKDVPERASDACVAQGFDRFADTFDEILTKLEYRAPAFVGRMLRRTGGEPRRDLDIVDAGCGTGLLAQYLRPYARRLVGVDLSRRMVEKAAMRSVYDELTVAELVSFLRASPAAFDIVASSDTLVYFGDLREALSAAVASLRPRGRLLFTLEHDVHGQEVLAGYRIHPDGRYMHGQTYVRRVLADAGFEAIDIETGYLRREGDAYVDGLIVAARRSR